MSYCVNCGVKLDESLVKCPLCNTPVINPKELKKIGTTSPYPTVSGKTEEVHSKDVVILTTAFLAATAICFLLLNILVFNKMLWSMPIVGGCIFIWIVIVPSLIFRSKPLYIFMIIDGLAMAVFLYLLSFMTSSKTWLTQLALPITALVTALIVIFTLLIRHVSASILSMALYIYIMAPVLCVGIELLICRFFGNPLRITWSAVVLVPCTIVSIALITISSRKRLREAVRRRLHF